MVEKPEEKSQALAAGSSGAEKKKRQKKINKMTPVELESVIKKTQTTMGGSHSRYAGALLKRKNALGGK